MSFFDQKGKGFAPTAFSETEVERVVGIGEERSALVLRSGVKIPVALSFEQLEQKIYERNFRTDSAVPDLRDVTGCVASNPSSGACGASEAPANTNQCVASNQSSPRIHRRQGAGRNRLRRYLARDRQSHLTRRRPMLC